MFILNVESIILFLVKLCEKKNKIKDRLTIHASVSQITHYNSKQQPLDTHGQGQGSNLQC